MVKFGNFTNDKYSKRLFISMATKSYTVTTSNGAQLIATITDGVITSWTIVLPSGRTVTVPSLDLLGFTRIGSAVDPSEGSLYYDGTLLIESEDFQDIRAFEIIVARKSEFTEQVLGSIRPDEQDPGSETGIDRTDPEKVTDPEELNGYGYDVPPDDAEEGPELLTPPDVDSPEELNGYGYNIPPDQDLIINEDALRSGVNPPTVGDDETQGYGNYPVGEPVLADDGTPSGLYRNPETGELYDPNGVTTYTQPESSAEGSSQGLFGDVNSARASASLQDQSTANRLPDWRVRLSLAPEANYLYKAPSVQGILAPLLATDGVIFPYTPSINMTFSAAYDGASPAHSNYKIFQYQNSSIDQIQITADFTAQDTFEANYLLATIHFFKSLTKMFYGQDENPARGTPPPLVFLNGLGAFQFNYHPLVITSFGYNLPNDVDYVRANVSEVSKGKGGGTTSETRLGTKIQPGGTIPAATFIGSSNQPTYVPTKMQIQLVAYPIVTRNKISNVFSLKDYALGKLTKGNANNGGIW